MIKLIILIVLLISVSSLMTIRHSDKLSIGWRFRANFTYELMLYVSEIIIMFFVFLWLVGDFGKYMGYSEKGWLKQFIDFFTVYQIFIFVVLKLYDSLKKDSYSSLLYNIEVVQPYLDAHKSIPEDIMIGKDIYQRKNLFISEEAYQYYKDFYTLLDYYENHLATDNKEKYEECAHRINLIKAKVNIDKEFTEFHWNVSLFFRVFKLIPFNKKNNENTNEEAPDNQ